VLALSAVKSPISASAPSIQAGLVSIRAGGVIGDGEVTVTPKDPSSVGPTPPGFVIGDGSYAFDITVSPGVVPVAPIKVCFKLPTIDEQNVCSFRVLHNESGILVDRTSSCDPATKTVCADVASLSPFVTAQPISPQSLTCPANLTVTAPAGQNAVIVNYPPPVLNDAQGAAISCSPPSGSSFVLGTTAVTCTAARSITCTFTVTVNAPVHLPSALDITCPADVSVLATAGQGTAVVNYPPPTVTPASGTTVSCSPPSGSNFPIGATNVICKATDASGDMAVCAFRVTVQTEAGFNICLQDDSSGDTMLINSSTGEYQFKKCADGLTLAGVGRLTIKDGVLVLEDESPDRRVIAEFYEDQNRGHASVQVFSLGMTFTIISRDTSKNTCACP
jgi:hypothetical protein